MDFGLGGKDQCLTQLVALATWRAGGSMASNWCKLQTDRNHKPCTNIIKYPQEDSSQAMENMVATRRQMDWRSRGSARPL